MTPSADKGGSLRTDERPMLRFLLSWLGVMPGGGRLRVAPSGRRMVPDSQGMVRPLVAVVSPHGAAVSVSPLVFGNVRRVVATAGLADTGLGTVLATLPGVMGLERQQIEVRHLWWTAAPLRLRPVVRPQPTSVETIVHSPLGVELVLPPDLSGVRFGEQLAHAADAAVARGAVALFTGALGDVAAAEAATAAGFRGAPWQLLRLTRPGLA